MSKRKSKPKRSLGKSTTRPIAAGSSSSVDAHDSGLFQAISQLSAWILPASVFLLGMLLVWSFLTPLDALSIFQGSALGQNLLALLVSCGLALSIAGGAIPAHQLPFGKSTWLVGLLLIAWLLLVAYLAGAENNPRQAWFGFWQLISLGASYLCLRSICLGPRMRAAVMLLVIVGCIAVSLHGLYQIGVQLPAQRLLYETDRAEFVRQNPLFDLPAGSPQLARLEARFQSPEPYGPFALANSLAVTLSAGVLLLAGVIGSLWTTRKSSPAGGSKIVPRVGALICCLMALAAVLTCWFLTRSRIAYLAVLASGGGLVLCWLTVSAKRQGGVTTQISPTGNEPADEKLAPQVQRRSRLGLAAAAIALFALAGAGWMWLYDVQVITEASKSLGYRLQYWQSSIHLLREHGIVGVGLGNFQSYYPAYKLPTASEEIADPHNWILDTACTLGIPFSVFLIAWIGHQFVQGVRSVLANPECSDVLKSEPESALVLLDRMLARAFVSGGLLGGLICMLALGLFKELDLAVVMVCWAIAAVAGCLLLEALNDMTSSVPQMVASTALAAGAAILICLLASGSWQASGIAMPFIATMVLAAQVNGVHRYNDSLRPLESMSKHAMWKVGAGGLPMLGIFIFAIQTWMPVVGAWSKQLDASEAQTLQQALDDLEAACDVDPLDVGYRSQLAQLQVANALSAAERNERQLFLAYAAEAQQTSDQWLSQDRMRFNNWRLAGNWAFDLAAAAESLALDPKSFLENAVSRYQMAVERYPTSVELRVQLAAALAKSGKLQASLEEIETAIELSSGTPHEDKQLGRHREVTVGDQQIWFPFSGPKRDPPILPPEVVFAEPMIEWVRSLITQ